MTDQKDAAQRVTQWGPNWSHDRMLSILSGHGAEQDRLSVARDLLGLQIDGFGKLQEAMEDPSRPEISWQYPFLGLRMAFPYEWDTEIPMNEVDASDPQRNLLISLSVLTGGAAAADVDGELVPLLPTELRDIVSNFTKSKRRTCLNA